MLPSFWLLGGFLVLGTRAITATENSTCYGTCGGGVTSSSDLQCQDDNYYSTDKGIKMRNCLLCESTSTKYNTSTDNDVYWFLSNMKYTLEWCLFDDTTSTTGIPSCETNCQPLKSILLKLWSGPPRVATYYYCDMTDNFFDLHVDSCSSCLQNTTGSVVLGNFLQAMKSGCQSKANATKGETIPIERSLFNTTLVVPSSSSTSTSTTTKTSTPSNTSTSTSPPSGLTSTGLSTSAAVGIGIGSGILGLSLIIGLIWLQVRRRRRKAQKSAKMAEMGKLDAKLPVSSDSNGKKGGGYIAPAQLDGTPVVEAEGRRQEYESRRDRGVRAELPGS